MGIGDKYCSFGPYNTYLEQKLVTVVNLLTLGLYEYPLYCLDSLECDSQCIKLEKWKT